MSRTSSRKNVSGLKVDLGSLLKVNKISVEHSKQFNLKSLGGVILPQLNDTLKTDILQRIANKTLTEVHVAMAPSVSFE